MTKHLIAGEEAGAIAEALKRMTATEPDEDGFVEARINAPIPIVAPLFRALMRVEAQLLLSDAADYPHTEESRRSSGERSVAALVQIAQRLRVLSTRP